MAIRKLAPDLHIIPGLVNIFVLETEDGLALIDTGFPNSCDKVLEGVRSIGRAPTDIRHIILTHAHPDHIGSAAALKKATGATIWAHPIDTPIIEAGTGIRPLHASPGLRNKLIAQLIKRMIKDLEGVRVDRQLEEGQSLPFLPDLDVIHVPGHCAGQVALLWKRRNGILFTADTCVNRRGIKLPFATEQIDAARLSLAKLSTLSFEAVCFMHGEPIMSGGDLAFRKAWFNH